MMLAADNDDEIGRSWKDIYQPRLILKKENATDWETHFLDLVLTLNDGRIKLSLYDKRDEFPFEMSFPDLSGGVHFSRSRGVIVGQLQRFGKANDLYPAFRQRAQNLTRRLFDRRRLEGRCGSVYDARPDLF